MGEGERRASSQKGHIPHMDSPPLFSLRPLGKCDAWGTGVPCPPWLHELAQCPSLSWVPERRARTFAEKASVSLHSAVIWSSQPPWEGVHSLVSRALCQEPSVKSQGILSFEPQTLSTLLSPWECGWTRQRGLRENRAGWSRQTLDREVREDLFKWVA